MKLNDIYNTIRNESNYSEKSSKLKFLPYAVTRKNFLLILRCLDGKSKSEIARIVINIKYNLSKCSAGIISMIMEFSTREDDFYLDDELLYYTTLRDKKNKNMNITAYTGFTFDWNKVPSKENFVFNRKAIFTDIDVRFIHSVLCTKINDSKVAEEFKRLRVLEQASEEFDNLYKKD